MMSGELKPYMEYKDSGVEWLGDVPGHWAVHRLKSLVVNVTDHTTERQDGEQYIALEHVQSWTGVLGNMGCDAPSDSQLKRFEAGDVLFGKLRPYLAKVARPQTGGFCVGEFFVLRSRDVRLANDYLERLLRSKPVIDAVDRSTFGARMPRAEWASLGNMTIARPPMDEQTAIARFLDYTDRRIQRCIRAKERLIALLEEQKQAVINEVVMGRIDVRTGRPYRAHKPSGVEWFKLLPVHWEIRRLKSLVKRIDQGVSPQAENRLADDTSWGVLKAGCVNGGVFRETEHKRLPLQIAIDPVLAVRTGDVLVSRASGSPRFVGSVGRIPSLRHNLILSDKTFRPIFNHAVDPDFMVFAMNCRYYRQQVEQAISGAEGLANNLPLSSLKSFRFAVPPLDEQRGIVTCLRNLTEKLTASTTRTTGEIALLNELNATVIASVVSGKVDVREAAAKLPEIDPLAADGPDDHAEASGDPVTGTGTETVEEIH
ncbi:MAG: hypothetical protein OXI15_09125 [Chromatiales bacterium]|nr:hypothetical protein [Chromatiales bacterium]